MRKKTLAFVVLALLLLGVAALPASATPPGTGTPGYWKKHPEAWLAADAGWPADHFLCLVWVEAGGAKTCTVGYSIAEAIDIMNTPVKGDKTYTLFRAMVAARLNLLVGNPMGEFGEPGCLVPGTPWSVWDVHFSAMQWIVNHPPGSGVAASSDAWQDGGEWKYEILDAYNNGEYYYDGELCAVFVTSLSSD